MPRPIPTHSGQLLNPFHVVQKSCDRHLIVAKSQFDGEQRDEWKSRREKEVFGPELRALGFTESPISVKAIGFGREVVRIDSLLGEEGRFTGREGRLVEGGVEGEGIGSVRTRKDSMDDGEDR